MQLLDTLEFLFKKIKICHRDLKPENIVISENFSLKLIDFGFATEIINPPTKKLSFKTEKFGTLNYLAPEVVLQETYCPYANDLFALGKILFEICTGHAPFCESFNDNDFLYKYITRKDYKSYWSKYE